MHVPQGRERGPQRTKVSDALASVLDDIECEREDVMRRALEIYASRNLDFVDCILAAMAEATGCEVLTFDKKLRSLISTA